MAYPHEHILIRFNGHFGTSGAAADRWSSGLRFGLPTSAPAYDPAKLQTFVNAAQTAANIVMGAAVASVGTNTFLDYVTGAQIGVLGKYVPSTQVTVVSPVTTTAGIGTPVHPWNVAHVISLRTANPRGRGSNGRLYWPAQALAVGASSGRVVAGTVTSRLNVFKTFCDSLNAAATTYSTGMRLVVASSVGGGLLAPVLTIRADDRMDSIERRENDTISTWQNATLA